MKIDVRTYLQWFTETKALTNKRSETCNTRYLDKKVNKIPIVASRPLLPSANSTLPRVIWTSYRTSEGVYLIQQSYIGSTVQACDPDDPLSDEKERQPSSRSSETHYCASWNNYASSKLMDTCLMIRSTATLIACAWKPVFWQHP